MPQQANYNSLQLTEKEETDKAAIRLMLSNAIKGGALQKNASFNTAIAELKTPQIERHPVDILTSSINAKYDILKDRLKKYLEANMVAGSKEYSFFISAFHYANSIIILHQSAEYKDITEKLIKLSIKDNIKDIETFSFSEKELNDAMVFELSESEGEVLEPYQYVEKEYDTLYWNSEDSRYGEHGLDKKRRYFFEICKILKSYSKYSFIKTFQDFKNVKSFPCVADFKEKLDFHFNEGNKVNTKQRFLTTIFKK